MRRLAGMGVGAEAGLEKLGMRFAFIRETRGEVTPTSAPPQKKTISSTHLTLK